MSDLHVALSSLAYRAARDAGALIMERFGHPAQGLTTKQSSGDMVSDADRRSERHIVEMIRAERPDDAVLGEEFGVTDGSSGITWVIDPLDGTTNFLYGIPQFCVSIGVEDSEGAVAGVVFDPVRAEVFAATRGGGATRNLSPISCSRVTNASAALLATGFGYEPESRSRWGGVVASLLPRVRDIRRAGAAALDLAWCAAGRVDAYAEIPVARWDSSAGALIASEAGCRVSVLEELGESGSGVLAAPPELHDELLTMIAKARTDA